MNLTAQNILNDLLRIQKDVFTKHEIITLIKDTYGKNDQPVVVSNGVMVDPQTMTVIYKDKCHTLAKKEFELLYYLILNKNKLLKREQIFNDVWGNDVYIGMRTIDVHIRRLRMFICEDCIKTNKGIGYQWIEL